MKILEKTNEKITFAGEMKDSLANALRRSALEIPILAIDEVEFHKNDSVLYDEILALRLGLVPFKTPKDMELLEECSCKGKGCAKCTIQLKLSQKGPGTVYSKELHGQAEPVFGDVPIVELIDEQEIELIATLRLGKGKTHTKYSPGLVYYRNAAEIKQDKDAKGYEDCIKECPQNILKIDKGKFKFIDEKSAYQCDLCEACVEACNKLGKQVLEIVPGKEIIFTIESWGQLKAEEILLQSMKAIKKNLKDLE